MPAFFGGGQRPEPGAKKGGLPLPVCLRLPTAGSDGGQRGLAAKMGNAALARSLAVVDDRPW